MGHDTGDKTAATMAIDSALVRELAELLADTGLSEIEVEDGSRKIRVARTLTAAPVAQMVAAPAPVAAPVAAAAAPAADAAPPPIWPVRSSRRWSARATCRPNRALPRSSRWARR
jgi:acetyl-CoA carboxylase biotin carboxyl carrier protein